MIKNDKDNFLNSRSVGNQEVRSRWVICNFVESLKSLL